MTEAKNTDESMQTPEQEPIQTEWVVIDGGPSSGKSTTVRDLEARGFTVVPEAAEQLLREEYQRKDEVEFNHVVLERKIQNENNLNPQKLVFFDRGIPDTIAYARYYKEDDNYAIQASRKRKYRRVFLLDHLSDYEKTGIRIEKNLREFATKMNQLLYQAYTEQGYEIIRVPPMSVEGRSKFILKSLGLPNH